MFFLLSSEDERVLCPRMSCMIFLRNLTPFVLLPLCCGFFFFFLIYLWMISSDQNRNQNVAKRFFCFLVCFFWPHCYRFRAVKSWKLLSHRQVCPGSTLCHLACGSLDPFAPFFPALKCILNYQRSSHIWAKFMLSTLLPVTWLTSKHCTTWPWTEFAVMSIAGKIGNCQVFSTCE